MTSKEFAYWLQGFFEISGESAKELNAQQTDMVKRHLALVFKHEIDPSYSIDPKVQEDLQNIHDGKNQNRPPHWTGGEGKLRC
jgi:hypothetical protein